MKVKAILGGILTESAYFKYVIEAKRKLQTYVRPKSTVQALSTQAVLDRDPALDEEHFNRPFVDASVRGPSGEVSTNERSFSGPLDLASLQSVYNLRLKGHSNVLGQSPRSTSPLAKARAVEAFMAKGGAVLSEAEKTLIHRYYEVMEFPDLVPSKEEAEIIRKFHELVDKDLVLVGDPDGT